MSEILYQYEQVNPTTWVYLASLLVIALYFKFNRGLSVRNWDLVGLILLAPALLMVRYGLDHGINGAEADAAEQVEHFGYVWLFSVSGLFMLRLLLDAFMVRRPLLEANLTVGGLTFLGISLFVFLMANVINGTPDSADLVGSQRAAHLQRRAASHKEINTLKTHGPGFPLIYLLPHISTEKLLGEQGKQETAMHSEQVASGKPIEFVQVVSARAMAILSQLAIVLGLVLVGMRHFDNIKTGIAAATLYLLLPYTAMWTGSVTHALPGALLVWAVVMYRRPLLAGAMIGLAFGTIYYPIFLLPLWIGFYWQRGLVRFLIGAAAMVGLLVLALAVTSSDTSMFLAGLQQMFGLRVPAVEAAQLSGAWQFWKP